MHALIIEQDSWVALMIEDALADLGYTSFDVAVSADDAFVLAAAKCPDLIAADVLLGPACGIETVRTICSGRYIPVVFLTADIREARMRDARLKLIQKPFGPSDLKAAIQAASHLPAAA